jgi:hypothetical protein
MRGRGGRKSIAALSVQAVGEALPRPDAPYDLTDEQAAEWWAVVNRMPADWFKRETFPLLTQYCRHIIAARRIAKLLEALQASIPEMASAAAANGASPRLS